MTTAAEKLLTKGYDPKFVAGVLGNIQNEGTPGKFESSAYISKPSDEPPYLKYMDNNFEYRSKYSGKTITVVGIKEATALAEKAKQSGYQGKFGVGMIQWTGERTCKLLNTYKRLSKSNNPSADECSKIEATFIVEELESSEYSGIYSSWQKGAATAESAGDIVCRKYEKPRDIEGEAVARANNAKNIYDIMMR